MALTVVKRKNSQGRNPIYTSVLPTISTLKRNTSFKVVQPDRNTNIVVRTTSSPQKIIRTDSGNIVPMKRNNNFNPVYESTPKTPKLAGKQFSLQRIASTGTPLTTFDGKVLIQSGSGNNIKQQIVRSANPIKIKPGTAVKIEPNQLPFIQSNGTITTGQQQQQQQTINNTIRRPTIFIKGPTLQKKTIRNITIELIEKNPYLHLGITEDRLSILQNIICPTINITRLDLYITLKKLRLNEDFQLLGEYFEYSEYDIQKIFQRTLIKLSKCMKYLVRWPESKKYYDRHKNLPIQFRSKLSYVQSLIECVETDVKQSQYPQTYEQLECKNYKYIITITPNGIISYISNAYVGNNNDDLTIFNACNFRNIIPKYLSLVADPGKAIRKKAIKTSTTQDNNNDEDSGGGGGGGKSENVIITSGDGHETTIKQENSNNNNNNTFKSTRITNRTDSVTSITSTSGHDNIDKIIKNSFDSDTDTDSTTDSADEFEEIIESDGNRKLIKRTSNKNVNSDSKKYNKRSSASEVKNCTMNIINSELTSLNVKDFSIPTVRVREPACRLQIRNLIYLLREFKILQSYNVLEPQIYQYINEILVICSAIINLQR